MGHHLRMLVAYRELLVAWAARETTARYRQSVLGVGWVAVQPFVQMVVISVVFGRFVRVPSEGVPYAVFAYVALLPWTLLSSSVTSAVPSLAANMNLITKVYMPREIFPIGAVIARIVDFGVASVVFVGLMLWFRAPVYGTITMVPLLISLEVLFILGVVLLGSSVSVYVRDISFAVPVAIQLWMYASPVIYPLEMVPVQWRSLYLLNPMAVLIDSFRQVILHGTVPSLASLVYVTVVAVALALLSYAAFKRLEMAMTDVI
jgi:lipopolysaccharide transport system permease protein